MRCQIVPNNNKKEVNMAQIAITLKGEIVKRRYCEHRNLIMLYFPMKTFIRHKAFWNTKSDFFCKIMELLCWGVKNKWQCYEHRNFVILHLLMEIVACHMTVWNSKSEFSFNNLTFMHRSTKKLMDSISSIVTLVFHIS